MSPALFTIFYDTLVAKIERFKHFQIVYVDDVVLSFTSIKELKAAIVVIQL